MAEHLCTYASEDVRVNVLPGVGARLHSLEAFGVSLLRTPDDLYEHSKDPFYWGAYHMAPWCNRLSTATTKVGTRIIALRPNFPDGTAIHGQVFAARWAHTGDGLFSVNGCYNDWPWTYCLMLQLTVSGHIVCLDYTLTNTSDEPMPAGLGFHPWFRRPLLVRIPATSVFPVNAHTMATPEPLPDALDLRSPRPVPDGVDATWAGLASPEVELTWPTERVSLGMRIDAGQTVIVAACPGGLRATAVEPQTHAPLGLSRLLRGEPYGMRLLQPGDALKLGLTLNFRHVGRKG